MFAATGATLQTASGSAQGKAAPPAATPIGAPGLQCAHAPAVCLPCALYPFSQPPSIPLQYCLQSPPHASLPGPAGAAAPHPTSQITPPGTRPSGATPATGGPTPPSQMGFKQAGAVIGREQLTVLSVEVHADSRGALLPDPR